MNQLRDNTHRALKRMLANGPLTAVPRRPSDQQLLVALAVAQFDPRKTYDERAVNETLKAWIGTFCEPYGIDHVTLRRLLVDSRFLTRTKSGSDYHVNRDAAADSEALAAIRPAGVLAEIRSERESRRRQHAT